MKKGDVLNGYSVDTAPTNAGGGMSQWAFGTKGGEDYFIKMFLSPKFPLDDGPGSEASKARKRAVCLAFEHRHVEIANRLDPSKPGAGNLVVATDFFRVDSTYVKVMPRVQAIPMPDIATLTGKQVLVLFNSLAFSLRMLHEENVVHGDIKPDNVMVEQRSSDLYISKLIDFDEAYVVGEPPAPEHIVGDPIYYSPELLRYIKRDERLPNDALTTASDMFSLGLLIHRFLTGELPGFDRKSVNYPAEALLGRGALDISAAPPSVRPMIAKMLSVVPDRRPSIQDLIDLLAGIDADSLLPGAPPPASPVLVRADDDLEDAVETATVVKAEARLPAGPMPSAAPIPSAPPRPSSGPAPVPPAKPRPASGPAPTPSPKPRPSSRPAPAPTPKPIPSTGSGLRSTMGRRRRPEDPKP